MLIGFPRLFARSSSGAAHLLEALAQRVLLDPDLARTPGWGQRG